METAKTLSWCATFANEYLGVSGHFTWLSHYVFYFAIIIDFTAKLAEGICTSSTFKHQLKTCSQGLKYELQPVIAEETILSSHIVEQKTSGSNRLFWKKGDNDTCNHTDWSALLCLDIRCVYVLLSSPSRL